MLAEKYRPRTFDQIIGQERAIRTLKWNLDTETPTGKVFLIFGPSGSGKTTLAECSARYWGVDDWDIRLVQSAHLISCSFAIWTNSLWVSFKRPSLSTIEVSIG